MTERQQSWTDEPPTGRVVLLSDNPISVAFRTIAETAGREVVLISDDADGKGIAAFGALDLAPTDAVVLCDHDAPDAGQVLRDALASPASYVAMLASRSRADAVLDELEDDESVVGLEKLHMPAGHNLGGKAPGEIALSIVAEIVAEANGRPGGSMTAGPVLLG